MQSISQFISDSNYRAIVSPNGRYVVKHSSEENYKGNNEIFLLYDNGKMIREVIGENCLFLGNEYLLKFPFWGYHEDCSQLAIIRLSDNSIYEVDYPSEIENFLVARSSIFSFYDYKVYYFGNVCGPNKDFSLNMFCIDVAPLIFNKKLILHEIKLKNKPGSSYLNILNNRIIYFKSDNSPSILELPVSNKIHIETNYFSLPSSDSPKFQLEFITEYKYLDIHTINSKMNNDGSFTTRRTVVGELLYNYKYLRDKDSGIKISKLLGNKILEFNNAIDVIIPIPPSNLNREFQPVFEIAIMLSDFLEIPYDPNYVLKNKPTIEIKNLSNYNDREELFQGVFHVQNKKYKTKNVLLVDDILRSGVTLKKVAETLRLQGEVKNIYAITATRTRTLR